MMSSKVEMTYQQFIEFGLGWHEGAIVQAGCTLATIFVQQPKLFTRITDAGVESFPATTFGREALRITVDGMHDIGPKIRYQVGFRRAARTNGTARVTAEMAGTTGDKWQELFFLVTRCTFATLSKTGFTCRHEASLFRPFFKEKAVGQ